MSLKHSPLRRVFSSIRESFAPAASSKCRCNSAAHSRRLNIEPLEERSLLSLTLTQAGVAASTIVVSNSPTVAAVYAAAELQADIQQITGALVPITTDEQTVTGNKILVGVSAATQVLGYDNSDFDPQEYTIDYQTDTLVLMGHDKEGSISIGATTYGTPVWVSGKFGNALQFDGASCDRMSKAGFTDAAGTMECWVRFSGSSNPGGTILRLDGSSPWSYHLLQRTSDNKVQYTVYDGTHGWTVISSVLTSDVWYHVLATHDVANGGHIQLFINGVSQGHFGIWADNLRRSHGALFWRFGIIWHRGQWTARSCRRGAIVFERSVHL